MNDLPISPSIAIGASELDFSFARSPGPGGQNVNKVNSQATLKWNVALSAAIKAPARERLISKNRNRINKLGELVITSHEHRDQKGNIEACRARLKAIVLAALVVPRKRRASQPTAGSIRRRLSDKKRLSEKKSTRRRSSDEA